MWVAAIQLNSTADMDHNLARTRELIQEAAHYGAILAALPEHFAYMGPELATPPSAQPFDGPLVTEFQALARQLGIFLLLGSFPEIPAPDRRPYNTTVFISPRGDVVARYRKIHLFDVDLAGGPTFQESQYIQPGNEIVTARIVATPFTAGLSICYDLRFPELYRALADRGADLIFIPSAFTFATGRDHWEVLVRARALENQAFVVAPAQWGQHSPGKKSYGRALIVDPWGTVLAQAPDGEGIIYARLDHGRVTRLRQEMPCLRHRRLR
jgi:predicted amidohydrolase